MTWKDFLLLALVAAALVTALRFVWKRRKTGACGSCSGGCAACPYASSCAGQRSSAQTGKADNAVLPPSPHRMA